MPKRRPRIPPPEGYVKPIPYHLLTIEKQIKHLEHMLWLEKKYPMEDIEELSYANVQGMKEIDDWRRKELRRLKKLVKFDPSKLAEIE